MSSTLQEARIMPRGKRTKKSGTAALTKGHTKSVFESVGSAAGGGGGFGGSEHVNGFPLKGELLNGDSTNHHHHHHFENEHHLERAIDELINGNVEEQSANSEYLDDHHHITSNNSNSNSSSVSPAANNNHSSAYPSGPSLPAAAASSGHQQSASSAGAEAGFRAVNGSVKVEPYSDHYYSGTGNNDPQQHSYKAEPGSTTSSSSSTSGYLDSNGSAAFGGGGGGGGGEDPERLLAGGELAAADTQGSLQGIHLPGGGGKQRLANGSAAPGSIPPSMQQRAPGSSVVGSGGGNGSATGTGRGSGVGGVVGGGVREMPAHWQLTPVGRGRVAPGNNGSAEDKALGEQRLSPAPPERIPTGFNERPIGDVPPALLNGDKNPVSALNEYGQKRGMEVRIEVVSQSGPPHNPSFCMAAFVGGRQFPIVESSNKKDGRREAAEAALRVLASNGNGWTKNNWATAAPTGDQAAGGANEVPIRASVTVPAVQETKPAKSSAGLSWQGKNPVSALYEYGQARGQHVCIEVIEQSGPPHNPRFLMAAFMGSHQFPPVEATNKKDGRTEAAVAALRSLSQGGDQVVAGGQTPTPGAAGDAALGGEKANGEAVAQVALPVEDEVAAQSKNPISVLNEYGQTKGVTVKFDVLNQSGPPHNPRFTIAAYVGDRQFDPVEASNKKEGKRQAAETALKTLVSEGECAEWARYANGVTNQEGRESPELNQPEDGTVPQQNQEQQSVHVSAEEFAALHKNPVSALNEYGQGKGLEVRIDVLSQRGPPHNPRFTIAASLGGRRFQSVVCTNKKDGRREAADVALRTLMAEGQYKVAQGLNQSNSNSGAMDNLGHFDKMAALAHRAFNTLAVTIPDSLSGRKVLAAMIMKLSEEDDGRVISLGTGNRCITGPQMSQEGATVNDSHAEVIARRGFLRFIYQNLLEYEAGCEESIVQEERGQGGKLKLKEGITFHLYISTAPCGDGALFSPSDASSAGADQNVDGGEHNPTFTTGVQGLLRTKMEAGEGTIPVEQDFAGQTWDGIMHGERLRTMSCSDKICRWNILGLQGALLSHFVETIYLNSLTLGYMYNHGHLTRAVCCRLEKGGKHVTTNLPAKFDVNHPRLGRVTMYDPPRETEKTKPISINWVLKDITPEVTDGSKGQVKGRPGSDMVSQIAKSSLYRLFKEVAKKYTCEDVVKNTYHASKQAASDYQKAKAIMCQAFRFGGCGEWVKKPIEQDMFF